MAKRIVLGDISEDAMGAAVIDTLEGDIYIDNGRLILEAPQTDEIEFLSDVLADIADIASQLDIPNYSDPANAPNETVLYDSTAERIKYKTSSGTVVSAGGVENPLTETLDADGNDVTNVGALDTDEINNIHSVGPNESIQSVLDGLSRPSSNPTVTGWAVVRCTPDATYNERVTIPNYTVLDLNGAYIQPETDGDVITLGGPGARLNGEGSRILAGSGYTFSGGVIVVDSADFGAKIDVDNDNTVGVYGYPHLINNANNGDLLKLVATDYPIALGNHFEVNCRRGDRQIVVETNNGNWINGPTIDYHGDTPGGSAGIIHENTTGSAAAGAVFVNGTMQARSSLDYAIRNATSETVSIRWSGELYDPQNPATAVSGPGIRVYDARVRPDQTNFGSGTVLNGVSHQSLAGATPDATEWEIGDVINDTDNSGTLHYIYDNSTSSGSSQIGT